MGRLRIKSTDILKWGFLGQVGRSAGKDFYNGAKDWAYTRTDTSGVDVSKLGALDDDGRFFYNRFEYTTKFEYVLWIIGLLILPIIFAPILLVKAVKRLLRQEIRFVNVYDCPTYKKDGRLKYGEKLIGYTPIPFTYVKSFDEARKGKQMDGGDNNAVEKARRNIIMYFVLAFAGFFWMYQVHSFFRSIMHQDDANKIQTTKLVTHWTDSIIKDDFTETSIKFQYLYPTTNEALNTGMVLVKETDGIFLYSNYSTFGYREKVDIKIFKDGKHELVSFPTKDYDYLSGDATLTISLCGFGKQEYDRKYKITDDLKRKIVSCDSFFIRNEKSISKFICK